MADLLDEQPTLLPLLLATARHDHDAFERLYQLTSSRLFAISMKLLQRRDWAEDALQDTYVRVWHRAADYHVERGSVLTWMISILRYRAIDQLRATRRETPLDSELHDPPDDSPGPQSQTVAADDQRALARCLDTLTETHRRSVMMAFIEGLTHEQLTERLQVPLGTVKSWVRRGLLSLRRCLETA